jgi:alkylation response protein AidB-like acyl-CoA dehydrogenase
VVDERAKDGPPSVSANYARVGGAQAITDMMDFLAEYLPDGLTGRDKELEVFYRSQLSNSIAAGTYEIQLNLIAQRALDLPKGKK